MNDVSAENPLTVIVGYFSGAAHLPVRPAKPTLLPLFTYGVYKFIDSISYFHYDSKA
jgi:hypothetical protein